MEDIEAKEDSLDFVVGFEDIVEVGAEVKAEVESQLQVEYKDFPPIKYTKVGESKLQQQVAKVGWGLH